MAKVLSGIRVLEVASWTFVPTAGAVLADWGADVLKVEPLTGDPQRGLIPLFGSSINYMAEHPNRGKRSIALNLKSEAGRKVLYRLAADCDVFLTNYLPAVRVDLEIDVQHIRQANPDIVYARGSAQGVRGPDASKGGFDGTSYWSRAGLANALTPDALDEPIGITPALGDFPSGMTLAGGIAAALLHRQRTGEACCVDTSLLSNGMWALATTITGTQVHDRQEIKPSVREQTSNPLTITYRTKDDRFIKLSLLERDKFWGELCVRLDRVDLIGDPKFKDGAARARNSDECVRVLDEVFGTRTLAEWQQRLATFGGAWGIVQTSREVLSDQQVLDNGYVQMVETMEGHSLPLVTSPVQFDEQPPQLRPAPEHGQHTEEILLEAGLSWAEIVQLQEEGALP
jgi:crotonobetainyl-CoA:carnitine CoA-transferase CaiB-like acyl-CoA transferase